MVGQAANDGRGDGVRCQVIGINHRGLEVELEGTIVTDRLIMTKPIANLKL